MNRMLLEGWEYPVAWEKVVGVGDLETEVGLRVAVVQDWAGPEVGEAVVTGDRRSRSHNGVQNPEVRVGAKARARRSYETWRGTRESSKPVLLAFGYLLRIAVVWFAGSTAAGERGAKKNKEAVCSPSFLTCLRKRDAGASGRDLWSVINGRRRTTRR